MFKCLWRSCYQTHEDDVFGGLCASDDVVLSLGLEHFKKKYVKAKEIVAGARTRKYLRLLGSVILKTKELANQKYPAVSTEDLFKPQFLPYMEAL